MSKHSDVLRSVFPTFAVEKLRTIRFTSHLVGRARCLQLCWQVFFLWVCLDVRGDFFLRSDVHYSLRSYAVAQVRDVVAGFG